MIRNVVAPVAVVLVVAGCAGGGRAAQVTIPALDTAHDRPATTGPRIGADADWMSRPTTVRDAAAAAQATLIATVTKIEQADPIVAAPDEVSPTQLVTLTVRDRWIGTVPDDFLIRWLGTPGGGSMSGDPPYAVGQDYILFLKKREDGPWYRPASPDGRLQILDGRVVPVIDGPVGDDARRMTPAQVKEEVTRHGPAHGT